MTREPRWQSLSILVLAVYFVASPWILGFAGVATAAGSTWVLGGLTAVSAILVLAIRGGTGLTWLTLTFGVLTALAPWVLGFAATAAVAWNAWLIGAAVVVLAVWQALVWRPGRSARQPAG